MSREEAERIATGIVQDVCELPDYNSPEDQPDVVTATVSELHHIILTNLGFE